MPWKETHVEEERMKFIGQYLEEEWTMKDLCSAYGISRKTGYKFVNRVIEKGIDGLRDESRAPLSHPNATPKEVEELIVAARKEHPWWGPRKLLAWLSREDIGVDLPAPSTAGDILKRRGLVKPRKRRRSSTPSTQPFSNATHPNAVWCSDFKGWFRTGDTQRCDPLTTSDAFSRFVLTCRALPRMVYEEVKPHFEIAFREYGLPEAIRTDNGSPFASTGLGGLTRLSVWWIKLGIRPERIEPGKPEQNGRHERFHLTLKQETASPPKATLRAQQIGFTRFLREFNYERPHEALGDRTPIEFYEPSPRPYPRRLPAVEYPGHFEVRSVHTGGEIRWRGEMVYMSEALMGERVGLEQFGDRQWAIHFGPLAVGVLDSYTRKVLKYQELRWRTDEHGDEK